MSRAAQGVRAVGRRGRARASGGSGFTLIELIISLVAGLMVAMAVVAVSKDATLTFHEEVRLAGAEMGLRVAIERLRLDIQRAAFMSTGNIVADPFIAQKANTGNNLSNVTNPTAGLLYLSGVFIHPGSASTTGAYVNADATYGPELAGQGLYPDAIDIGANFSTADEFVGAVTWGPSSVPTGCSTAAAISLQMNTPAGWRIQNAETIAQASGQSVGTALNAIFHPGTSTTSQFGLRLTDPSGRYQYLVGCAGTGATKYVNAPVAAMVYLDVNSAILTTSQTGGLGGVSGLGAGWVIVSPIQVAHWDIQTVGQLINGQAPTGLAPTAAQKTAYNYNVTATGASTYDPDEFLLTRTFLDFSACTSTACAPDTSTTEIIAEYAADLKFGVTVDTGPTCAAIPCTTGTPAYTVNPLGYYPVDGANALTTIPTYTGIVAPATVGAQTAGQGPQRIRDVQFRVAVRSQFGDRPNAGPVAGGTYAYRYLLGTTALHRTAANPYARVREATSEVNLPNQARFYW